MQRKKHLQIKSIVSGSLADQAGLQPGDLILEINGASVDDLIDFQFYSTDESLHFLVERSGQSISFKISSMDGETLGLEFESMQFCSCGNHCIFCFIDQNPKGMRETIYFKDEDYRLSFLFGNYVTLTQVNQADLDRIVRQRLSPLYVSIHAVQPTIRKKLLGIKKDDHLIEKMDFLVKNHIDLHGQIVLCPGINDGQVLEDSIHALSTFTPYLQSVSIVPVGLTKHRRDLPKLEVFNKERSQKLLQQVQPWQEKFKKTLGEPFVYLADEIYIRAGEPFPEIEHYGDFWQIDNGVGMMRWFLDDAFEAALNFPKKIERFKTITWVSGVSAAPFLRENILPLFQKIKNLKIQIHEVQNQFYGETVTVTGLLTAQDIIKSCRKIPNNHILVLPPNCLNHDKKFLDDLTVEDVSNAVQKRIIVFDNWESFWKKV